MNARQRRKAYRALPKAGTILELYRSGGIHNMERWFKVRVIGATQPVNTMATPIDYNFNGDRPSVHRVHVRIIEFGELGSTCSPKLTKLRSTPDYLKHTLKGYA